MIGIATNLLLNALVDCGGQFSRLQNTSSGIYLAGRECLGLVWGSRTRMIPWRPLTGWCIFNVQMAQFELKGLRSRIVSMSKAEALLVRWLRKHDTGKIWVLFVVWSQFLRRPIQETD